MAGALFIWMADWYGRTWHMFFGCLGVCLATIVTALSINLPMLIAGRFFLSFFATCAHTAAPLYLVEITPAAYRGTLAGLYNTFYNVVSLDLLWAFVRDITDDTSRGQFLRRQPLMLVTSIWLSMVTLTGGCLYGSRWSVLL